MDPSPQAGLAMTVGLALLGGIVAQSAARHLRIPGIVLLLGTGVLLGPEVAGLVDPRGLGGGLQVLVGFAVSVILFEGGLNLNWRRLRREGRTIQLLISLGALVSALGGTLAARTILGWEWRPAILFGTLVIVTGPTVIAPILRRCKVKRKLETVLEAESVLIDAVGAVVAVVALEVLTGPAGGGLSRGALHLLLRLAAGCGFGLAGGLVIALLLRVRHLVPEGLENVFTLALVFCLFLLANRALHETGIVAVVVAGLVVGNSRTPVGAELKEFKEQVTVLLIGMLFVLLAADVRQADALELGGRGLLVVAVLMVLVRPLGVLLCTLGSGMVWREKAFLAWLAPRGIVAAAVAGIFDERLTAAGLEGGREMRALVFMVIAVTVIVQGTTGGLLAGLLGLRRPRGRGFAILGAHPLARLLGRLLLQGGQEVVLIDTNARLCTDAEEEGFRVLFGNALEERVQLAAALESRRGAVGLLFNEAVNLLFVGRARNLQVPRLYVGLQKGTNSIGPEPVHQADGRPLFARDADLELWANRLRRQLATLEEWSGADLPEGEEMELGAVDFGDLGLTDQLLPLAVERRGERWPVDTATTLETGDRLWLLIFAESGGQARDWLAARGLRPVSDREGAPAD